MRYPVPLWVKMLIIIDALPVFSLPALIAMSSPGMGGMVLIYPAFVLMGAWLAWICWPERRVMSWIMIVLMALMHVAIWMLVTMPVYRLI
ncbi:MAG: hypothetical protein NC043_05490 [Muribaculaceae bacterium]|nr:hypothetical protein [Muribaculaceae bacterium]